MMDETEKKALARVNEVLREANRVPATYLRRGNTALVKALCRAIEQHEAFKRDVSDAVERVQHMLAYCPDKQVEAANILSRFILPKPDPLVEALTEAFPGIGEPLEAWSERDAKAFRAALAARGLEVREIEGET